MYFPERERVLFFIAYSRGGNAGWREVASQLAVPGRGCGGIWVSLLAAADRLPQRDQAQKTRKSALGPGLQRGT